MPSSASGKIKEVKIKPGDKVKVGQVVLTVDKARRRERPTEAGEAARAGASRSCATERRLPRSRRRAGRRKPKTAGRASEMPPEPAETPAPEAEAARREVVEIRRRRPQRSAPPPHQPSAVAIDSRGAVGAAARARARRRHSSEIHGSGPGGRISMDDVRRTPGACCRRLGAGAARRAVGPLPDFARGATIERKPMSGIRRKTAEH